MSRTQILIPIAPEASTATACAAGEVAKVDGSCSAASSCASGSSCAAGGATAHSDDPSDKLAKEGWILRTTIGEPRLSEVVENYRAMGYEVHIEYFATARSAESDRAERESCTTCFDSADRTVASQAWGSIYVRPTRSPERNDEWF